MALMSNGIERNRLDYLITDLLPAELPEQFSFFHFYQYLIAQKQTELTKCIEDIKQTRTEGHMLLFENNWATKPFKYRIMKGSDSYREMSIIQPFSALNVYFFIELYQKNILFELERNHGFSIRYHKKRADLYYKRREKTAVDYFQREKSQIGKGVIQQTGLYFSIGPFESLNSLTSSYRWRMANFRYRYFAKMDYKSCFDSIYSHAFSWLIEGNVTDAKGAKNGQLFIVIDRLLQNINGRSSNGILVGPEFSRMITEILLGHIDQKIEQVLNDNELKIKEDYFIYRYVDDIYVFANDEKTIEEIISAYKQVCEQYRMRLNELKMVTGQTPCLPKEWLHQARYLSEMISTFFYKGKTSDFRKLPEEDQYLVVNNFVPVDRLKDEILFVFKQYKEDRRSLVSFLLSTFVNQIGKVKKKYRLFRATQEGKAFLLLDLIMFIYVQYPSFDQTRKVISIIAYMDRELHFKTNERAKKKLLDTLHRYSFVFNTGNLPDLCEWLPFCKEYGIPYDMQTETMIINKTRVLNNPIIWGLVLMYSKYNLDLNQQISKEIEEIINKQMDMVKPSHAKEQLEFWYILVFHNCPYLSAGVQQIINKRIMEIRGSLSNIDKPNGICEKIVCDFLDLKSPNGKKPENSFFNWKETNNFGDRIAYRTYQRTLFNNFKKNKGFSSSLE